MRILLAHNYYSSTAPSGENQVFEAEAKLLRNEYHDVKEFIRESDEIRSTGISGAVKGALSTPWNPWTIASLRSIMRSYHPDIVHVHNTFPLISPSIFHAIGKRAARVLTLHNYRLFCPAAIPMRKGRVCTQCLDRRSSLPSMVHGCYRNSRISTAPLAFSVLLHRVLRTWSKEVDAFIVFSEFQRNVMVNAGLPNDRVYIKPNFYAGNPSVVDWDKRGNYAVFVGRLSPEKGLEFLIDAWLDWGTQAPELRVIGDGPLRQRIEQSISSRPTKRIRFFGQLSSADAEQQIANARILVLPSTWFEGFPMVIREAFAYGTPTAVSDIGPLPSIVSQGVSGVVFKPGDSKALLDTLRQAWNMPGLLQRLSYGAREAFEKFYTEKVNYEILMEIYDKAIAANKL